MMDKISVGWLNQCFMLSIESFMTKRIFQCSSTYGDDVTFRQKFRRSLVDLAMICGLCRRNNVLNKIKNMMAYNQFESVLFTDLIQTKFKIVESAEFAFGRWIRIRTQWQITRSTTTLMISDVIIRLTRIWIHEPIGKY